MHKGEGKIAIPHGNPLLLDFGVAPYQPVLELQRWMNHLRNEGLIGDAIMFLEHDDVYTLGIHRNKSEILSADIIPVEIERGGSATYHGPGQIVVYFIYNLKERNINIRDFIILVEKAVSQVLSEYGIQSEGRLHGETGVWVGNRKICSVGFAIKGFTTLHGIALNVFTDLRKFDSIMPCGMTSEVMTSVERESGKKVEMIEFRTRLMNELISATVLKGFIKIDSIKKMGNYSVSNGLRLLPEELLQIIE